ncbi:MAG: restriction endonuclease subunit S [Prevotella sp.]|nr:restriction endonuclease subunit S [Prevotella sp.]
MEEWKEYKLGDVCSRLRSGKGIKADSVFSAGKYPVIGGNGVRGYADEPNFEGQAVIIGRQGAYCGNVRFFEGEAYMTEHAIVAVGNELADTRFLACLLSLMHLGNLSAQSAQPGISVQTLSKQSIRLPSISYQKKVSAIIKSLDDKIEVNRRINDNLEQQAQALFKSWFVEFEPFRDQPFVESELGKIPEEWKVIAFKDFIVASTEKVPVDCYPEYSVTNNGIIPRGSKFNKKLSKSTSKNKVLRKDNLVFGMSREILNWGIMEDEVGGVSSAYNIFIIDKEKVSPTYLRLYMRARISDFNSLIGTAAREGQSLDKGQLMQKQIYIPTSAALQDFFDLYSPLTKAQLNIGEESRRLAQLRDTLLPRLISGEIKVGDVTL